MWDKLIISIISKNLVSRLGSWKTTVGGIILGVIAYLNHVEVIDKSMVTLVLSVLSGTGILLKDDSK